MGVARLKGGANLNNYYCYQVWQLTFFNGLMKTSLPSSLQFATSSCIYLYYSIHTSNCLYYRHGSGQLKVMFIGGPNQRKDYHLDEGEEVGVANYYIVCVC